MCFASLHRQPGGGLQHPTCLVGVENSKAAQDNLADQSQADLREIERYHDSRLRTETRHYAML